MRKGEAEGLFRECRAKACPGPGRLRKGRRQLRIGIFGSYADGPGPHGPDGPDGAGRDGLLQNPGPGNSHRPGPGRSLGDRSGIRRYGSASVPMDEALADVALDFSGRPYLVMAGEFRGERIGDFEVQLLQPFLEALCVGARLTLHVRFYGENDHHKAESIFKALGFAIRQAVAKEGTGVPSTKGVI